MEAGPAGLQREHVVVAIWGFLIGSGESILGVIPINTPDNILHLILGIAGLTAGLATRGTGARAVRPAGAQA